MQKNNNNTSKKRMCECACLLLVFLADKKDLNGPRRYTHANHGGTFL